METGGSLHPFVRWEVVFRIEREQDIGSQLRALGMGPSDVKQVVLTHLHMDHDGGLAHFPTSKVLVTRRELHAARGWAGAFVVIFRTDGRPGSTPCRSNLSRNRSDHFP